MRNGNQRTAILAIASGHKVRKVTFDALVRKGYAKAGPHGKQMLTKQGVAWLLEVIPNFYERDGTAVP